MENFNNNLNLKISENIGHISEYLINRHLENPNDIIPLFKFGDENNMELNELNNKYMFLINTDNYEELGIKNRADLRNKYIVYLKYTKDGVYVGQTNDFNEREHTHFKDTLSENRPLYESIRERGVCYTTILHIFDKNDERFPEDISRIIEKKYTERLLDFKKIKIFNNLIFNQVK